jgi:replicative superfamily II helicase
LANVILQLRDRLQTTKQAQNSAESAMQTELQLIGRELSAFTRASLLDNQSTPAPSDQSSSAEALLSRLRSLEQSFLTFKTEIDNRTTNLEKDLESSLIVSEKRAKRIDELYREASAENEALYDRFNSELNKVVKEVRVGNGQEILKTQLKSSLEELSRVKKENLRLKREVGGLKAVRADIEVPNKDVVEVSDA